jgi:signal transduction histidine kinase
MAIQTNAAVALKYPEGIRTGDAEKFQAINSASSQLTALTENLLLLARSDQIELQKQEVINLTVILQQLLNLYQFQAKTKEIYLKTQLEEDLYIKGDRLQLTQLLTNLIDNALRYTHEGDTIEIIGNKKEQHLTIAIEDTGIGIASEHLEHIFEPFWQVEQARSYQTRGFGLGLAIAQNIARNHGGLITVTSKLGQGSCFKIELPSYWS